MSLLTETLNRLEFLVTQVPDQLEDVQESYEETLRKYRDYINELTASVVTITVFTDPKVDGSQPVSREDLLRSIHLLSKAIWKIQSWSTLETMLREAIRKQAHKDRSGIILVDNG